MNIESTLYEPKVLIVDPTNTQRTTLSNLFFRYGIEAHYADTAREALAYVRKKSPSLVLLEVILPDSDGIEVCMEIKKEQQNKSPIIVFYTDRKEDYTQIAAFEAGADDYLIKPQHDQVLLTRLRALLNRQNIRSIKPPVRMGDIEVDRERYLVIRNKREIVLPRKAFELLALLMNSPRKVFTRQEIYREVWGGNFENSNRTIDVHIRMLRELVGEDCVKTVKGVGYALGLKKI